MTNCGKIINKARQRKRLTLQQTATAIGFESAQSVCSIEKGRMLLPFARLSSFSRLFDIQRNDLLRALQKDIWLRKKKQ